MFLDSFRETLYSDSDLPRQQEPISNFFITVYVHAFIALRLSLSIPSDAPTILQSKSDITATLIPGYMYEHTSSEITGVALLLTWRRTAEVQTRFHRRRLCTPRRAVSMYTPALFARQHVTRHTETLHAVAPYIMTRCTCVQ